MSAAGSQAIIEAVRPSTDGAAYTSFDAAAARSRR
jgi:hypothetical protein